MNSKYYSTSTYLQLTDPTSPYCYETGIVRWNSQSQSLEVMGSGNNWTPLLAGIGTINLRADATLAISWAHNKMLEEAELKRLCAVHPELQTASDHFSEVLELVKQNDALRKKHEEELWEAEQRGNDAANKLAQVTVDYVNLKEMYNTWKAIAE